jgi:hypothetical protein
MAFGLVLTMISGARELLTPGAWDKVGATYKLNASRETLQQMKARENEMKSQRYARMELLKTALWDYATAHGGAFPPDDRDPAIPALAWESADPSRARCAYIPGRKADVGSDVIVHEPANIFDSVMTLTSDGGIRAVSRSQLKTMLQSASASAAPATP